MRGHPLGVLGVGGGLRGGRLVGHLARVDHAHASRGHGEAPVRVLHGHAADDTVPVPLPWRLLPRPAWLCEPQGPGPLGLAPRLHLLAHHTGARHSRDHAHALREPHPQRACTRGLPVRHTTASPVASACHTRRKRSGSLGAVTGMARAQAQTDWETLPAHPQAQEHVLQIIRPICAGPRGRTRRDPPLDRGGLLLIGPRERDRRRLLMEPGGRDGRDLQGVAGESPTHAVAMGGTPGIAELPQSIIRERGACEAGLEEGSHPTLLSACPDLREGLMAIAQRQEQGCYAPATREDRRGVRRAEGLDERRDVALADAPQPQRHVGHRTDVRHGNGQEGPLLQSCCEVPS